MLVKEILKKVVNYTCNYELYDAISKDTFSDSQQKEINLLIDCVNLTNCNIATNYVKLIDSKEMYNSGTINYSKITNQTIYDIISVKSKSGKVLDYVLTSSGINTSIGFVTVKYSYFPADLEYGDTLTNFPTKINERIFVYGVISEYLYVKGVFDEARVWEEKFKLEIQSLLRQQNPKIIKQRRWY